MRILLIAVAFVLPIAVIGYLQVSELNRAATRLVLEREGLVCLGRGYAVLRAIGALETASDPKPVSAVRTAFAGFASAHCPERADFARLSGTEARTPRSRYAEGRAVDHLMKNLADDTYLTFDASPATVDAATAMAYSLSDALPLLGLVSSTSDRIDVAKTRATASSRLGMLDIDVSDLLNKAPWAARFIDGPKRREAAAVAAYFRPLVRWVRHPGAARPNAVLPMRAATAALNELFSALARVANANTIAQLEQVERRRTRVISTAVFLLALALAIVWFVARGVVARHRAEIARFGELALKEARFQAIFVGSPLPIAITDLSGVVFECNRAYLELVGVSLAQAERAALFGPSRPTNALAIAQLFAPLRDKTVRSAHIELSLSRDDGSPIHCHATATLVRTPGDAAEYCAIVLQDVTERQLRERRLRHAATHDALTGIANRSHVIAQLERCLEQPQGSTSRFALLFIDVDDFKTINDQLGHAAGDACLVAIAQRLRSSVRSEDVVARYGGDEFALLLRDGQSIDDAAGIALRLRREVAAPIEFGDAELRVSCSIGLAVDGDAGVSDPEGALASADRAMYLDKTRGTSRAASILRRCA